MFASYFIDSSVYGATKTDLIPMKDIVRFIIVQSLPMESLKIYISNNIPNVKKCYTLFSHSDISWKIIKVIFLSFQIRTILTVQRKFPHGAPKTF